MVVVVAVVVVAVVAVVVEVSSNSRSFALLCSLRANGAMRDPEMAN